jgi:hypothetical protein
MPQGLSPVAFGQGVLQLMLPVQFVTVLSLLHVSSASVKRCLSDALRFVKHSGVDVVEYVCNVANVFWEKREAKKSRNTIANRIEKSFFIK